MGTGVQPHLFHQVRGTSPRALKKTKSSPSSITTTTTTTPSPPSDGTLHIDDVVSCPHDRSREYEHATTISTPITQGSLPQQPFPVLINLLQLFWGVADARGAFVACEGWVGAGIHAGSSHPSGPSQHVGVHRAAKKGKIKLPLWFLWWKFFPPNILAALSQSFGTWRRKNVSAPCAEKFPVHSTELLAPGRQGKKVGFPPDLQPRKDRAIAQNHGFTS